MRFLFLCSLTFILNFCSSLDKSRTSSQLESREIRISSISAQLTDNVVTNLQNQIDEVKTEINNQQENITVLETKVRRVGRWTKILSLTTPGTYEWDVPDYYGDGKAFFMGIFVIGAGGSGASGFYKTDAHGVIALGGAGGWCTKDTWSVLPGYHYIIKIGNGGNPVKATFSGNYGCLAGNQGETTSISNNERMLIRSIGGYGGSAMNIPSSSSWTITGSSGEQWSGVPASNPTWYEPYGGAPVVGYMHCYNQPEYTQVMGNTSLYAYNSFEDRPYSGAGGLAYIRSSQRVATSGGKYRNTGLGGGDGALNGAAGNATECGCGGGGSASWGTTPSYTSGKGGDGAVFLYVKDWY